MAKAKILKKQKKSSKSSLKVFKLDEDLFLDRKLIAEVLTDCILNNDIETFRDVLITHLRTVSKGDLAEATGVGRQTIYDLIEGKNFDPKLSTLTALLSKRAG